MSLFETIQQDLKQAIKAQDALVLSTLRMTQAALHNKALEKRAALAKEGKTAGEVTLTDEETVAVIRTEVKRRRDAAQEFSKGGRAELAEKESSEMQILQKYLPAEADDDVVERAVRDAISETGADAREIGKAIGAAMKKLAGRASGERVAQIARKILAEEA